MLVKMEWYRVDIGISMVHQNVGSKLYDSMASEKEFDGKARIRVQLCSVGRVMCKLSLHIHNL